MPDQVNGLFSGWLRKRRMNIILPFLKGNILDFGCGTGELAKYVSPDSYFGVDKDTYSIKVAKQAFPSHNFDTQIPEDELFDTIVLLAVIEHIEDPAGLLEMLTSKLKNNGKIVLTSPNPSFEFVHSIGSKIGLFSKLAAKEHQQLFDLKAMELTADKSSLYVKSCRRFIFGANQMFILSQS